MALVLVHLGRLRVGPFCFCEEASVQDSECQHEWSKAVHYFRMHGTGLPTSDMMMMVVTGESRGESRQGKFQGGLASQPASQRAQARAPGGTGKGQRAFVGQAATMLLKARTAPATSEYCMPLAYTPLLLLLG